MKSSTETSKYKHRNKVTSVLILEINILVKDVLNIRNIHLRWEYYKLIQNYNNYLNKGSYIGKWAASKTNKLIQCLGSLPFNNDTKFRVVGFYLTSDHTTWFESPIEIKWYSTKLLSSELLEGLTSVSGVWPRASGPIAPRINCGELSWRARLTGRGPHHQDTEKWKQVPFNWANTKTTQLLYVYHCCPGYCITTVTPQDITIL